MSLTFGVVALARPTFDVPFAETMAAEAFAALDAAGIKTVGPRALLMDGEAARRALAEINASGHRLDKLLILQITFTDASMTLELAHEAGVDIAIWAVPEPRLGGRLRLNAFCGLNLAAHALKKAGYRLSWLFAAPDAPHLSASLLALGGEASDSDRAEPLDADASPLDDPRADDAVAALKDITIGLVGERPTGFDTCDFDRATLAGLTGARVHQVPLEAVFDAARAVDPARAGAHRGVAAAQLAGVDDVDQAELDRSMRTLAALEDLQDSIGAAGLAVRCWPEFFTDYGCAVCGAASRLNEAGIPTTCEADVHGALSQLLMQHLAGTPAWLTDLVDFDFADDSAVLWHCGSAPISMRDPESPAEATLHTNRRMPLLNQYVIKPGRITIARISQAKARLKMLIAGAEVVRAPMAFTGTSGTIRFDRPAREVCGAIIDEGLEHHFAFSYGDHRQALKAVAARLDLPVLEIA